MQAVALQMRRTELPNVLGLAKYRISQYPDTLTLQADLRSVVDNDVDTVLATPPSLVVTVRRDLSPNTLKVKGFLKALRRLGRPAQKARHVLSVEFDSLDVVQ